MDVLINEIKNEFKLRVVEESMARITKCLDLLEEDDIWRWPNDNIPSVGNLILHLNGNVRQWFLEGLCNISFNRLRDVEFSTDIFLNKEELYLIIQSLRADFLRNIDQINLESILEVKTIQKFFEVSGYSIINHVTEHFSYHTGQISTLTKIWTNQDLGYYSNLDL